MTETKCIVGIAGPSAAGKSHLARVLAERIEEAEGCTVTILCEDSYCLDRAELLAELRDLPNYDHPSSIEHSLLVEHLQMLRRGQMVGVPVYQHGNFHRAAQRLLLQPSEVVLVEGILLLADASVRSCCDITVFVDAPPYLCLQRRLKRDPLERGLDVNTVLQQYFSTVLPMARQYVSPSKVHAEFLLKMSGESFAVRPELQQIAERVGERLRQLA